MVQEKHMEENLKERFDEGLGTVYERFRLNYIFRRLLQNYKIDRVLEYPVYGMTGVDGINSVYFAQQDRDVELMDCDRDRLKEIESYWNLLNLDVKAHYVPKEKMSDPQLPLHSYDFVWNFAALWFYPDADGIIEEMIELSRNLIMISVNNAWQIGYPLRKYLLDKEFFSRNRIDTRWIQMPIIRAILRSKNMQIIEEGVFDTPPWPDTCLPLDELKKRLGFKCGEKGEDRKGWLWSMMAWYAGQDPTLEKRVRKFMFIEDSPLPKFVKQFWSHHRYIIAQKS